MKISRKELIEDLLHLADDATVRVSAFRTLSPDQLNFKPDPTRWSILECIEHLNLYGEFYLPEIERRILAAKPASAATTFSSGLLGNYFANLMKVTNGKIKKMQSPKDKNPAGSSLTSTTIERFLKQQEWLRSLLTQAQHVDLTNTKASISLTSFVKLRLGDTFRFFIYHIDRHVTQAQRVLATLERQSDAVQN
jgi:hypothetical protein